MHHYAFLEEEFANGLGLLDLDRFLADDQTPLVVQAIDRAPDQVEWTNLGDPHGIAVTTGVVADRLLGFLVDSRQAWVARIDLETFAHGNLAKALTFLDARTMRQPPEAATCPGDAPSGLRVTP